MYEQHMKWLRRARILNDAEAKKNSTQVLQIIITVEALEVVSDSLLNHFVHAQVFATRKNCDFNSIKHVRFPI